jgi:hypothetical protein
MGFAVRGEGAYDASGRTVECGLTEDWIRGRAGQWRCERRRADLSLWLWLKLQWLAGEFDHATLYVRQSR